MTSPSSDRIIRFGPAGWSYPDWRDIVYPAHKPKAFHELEYVAQFFDTVEINTSFYNPPRPGVVKEWIHQAEHNKQFQFTAKLWQRFTHDRNATLDDERVFKEAMAPLVEAGRLGALLIQFPWSFKNDPENRQYLADLCRQFREYPLVLEVRHSSWNQPEILEMLTELDLGFCNIDQPIIGRSIKPSQYVTGPVGYVRLHGRNYKEWFSAKDKHEAGERYNYLYSLEELEPWVEKIKQIAAGSRATFVIANNHARGQAVANALQLTALVTARTVPAPESILQEYPELVGLAAPPHFSVSQFGLPFGPPTHKTHNP